MKNKKSLILIICFVGLILIIGGVLLSKNTDENSSDNKDKNETGEKIENPSGEEKIAIDYEYAYQTAVSLYGGEGRRIEVVDSDKEFIIYIHFDKSEGKLTYYMDKETGFIRDGGIIGSNSSSN